MAIQYKSVVKSVTTTGSDQTIYTCPTSTTLIQFTAIVKTFTIHNTTGGGGTVDVKVTDSSASATQTINHFTSSDFATKKTVDAAGNGPIVLESADILKIDTSVQPANVLVSVMEISDSIKGA